MIGDQYVCTWCGRTGTKREIIIHECSFNAQEAMIRKIYDPQEILKIQKEKIKNAKPIS